MNQNVNMCMFAVLIKQLTIYKYPGFETEITNVFHYAQRWCAKDEESLRAKIDSQHLIDYEIVEIINLGPIGWSNNGI